MPREVMNIDDVAAYLRIGRRSVYALVKHGEIPARKVAGAWRFHFRDVEAWLRNDDHRDDHHARRDSSGARRVELTAPKRRPLDR